MNRISPTQSLSRASIEERPLPTAVRRSAILLNTVLFLTETLYLIPRAGVRDTELLAVCLLVATPVVNLVMFVDYHRRGLVTAGRSGMRGDPRSIPAPARWLVVGMNVLLLFSLTVLWLERGINVWNMELLVAALWAATPVVSLAAFLDYNRRGL